MPHFPFPSPAQKHLHHSCFLKRLHTNPPSDASSCQAIPINSQLKRPFLSSLSSPQPQVILSSCRVPYLWKSAHPSGYLSLSPHPSKMSLSRCSWKFPMQLANGRINYCQVHQWTRAQIAIGRLLGRSDRGTALAAKGCSLGEGLQRPWAPHRGTTTTTGRGKGPCTTPRRAAPPPPRGPASPR